MTATNEPYVWLCVDATSGKPFVVPFWAATDLGPSYIRLDTAPSPWPTYKPPELCPLSNSLRIEAFLAGEDNV